MTSCFFSSPDVRCAREPSDLNVCEDRCEDSSEAEDPLRSLLDMMCWWKVETLDVISSACAVGCPVHSHFDRDQGSTGPGAVYIILQVLFCFTCLEGEWG